jgi:hypothetical protein
MLTGRIHDPLLSPDTNPISTPGRRKREEDLLARRSDYLYLITFGGISTFLAVLLVAFSLICSLVPMSGSKLASAVLAFQVVHFLAAMSLVGIGGWLVYALARKVLASPDAAARKPSWNAGVGAILLGITALFDVISNILQIIGRDPSVTWMCVAEDVFTIPETLVSAAILILLELNHYIGTHYRRAKIALLPLITGLSLAFIILNIVGVNTWNDVVADMGLTLALCRVRPPASNACIHVPYITIWLIPLQTLAIMYRGGTLLMSLDHTLRAFGDLLHNPNRHAKAYEAGRPLAIGSGEFRAVDALESPVSVLAEDFGDFGHELADEPKVAEAKRLAQHITLEVEHRGFLFGRRPFASVVSFVCGGMLLLVVIISRTIARSDTSLDTVANVSLGVLAAVNIVGLGWFVCLGYKEHIMPREVSWEKQIPQPSTLLRVFAPSLLSVAWLLMVAMSGVSAFTSTVCCMCAFASLLQGSVFTFSLANAPLVFVVSSQSSPTAVIPSNTRGFASPSASPVVEKLPPPSQSALVRTQSLVQMFSSMCVTLNVCLLALSIWPDALSCASVNSEVDIASRAVGAFFHAFCVGIAYNARGVFEFLSHEETTERTRLYKQIYGGNVGRSLPLLSRAPSGLYSLQSPPLPFPLTRAESSFNTPASKAQVYDSATASKDRLTLLERSNSSIPCAQLQREASTESSGSVYALEGTAALVPIEVLHNRVRQVSGESVSRLVGIHHPITSSSLMDVSINQ